ncbi:DUF1905 domain-containing protein [Fulvivirga sp. RKSG066]|nr:DUF1905 domain-containing protein [Fulvivirga aurantia]
MEHKSYSFILWFTENKSSLQIHLPTIVKVAKSDTTFWVAYPKKSGQIDTNLTRDKGWEVLDVVGYRKVSQISIDEDWSALRIKPTSEVKSSPKAKTQTFEATIETSDSSGGAWVNIPFDVKEVFGTKGQVKVKAKIDGQPYRGSIANMGTGSHILIVKKEIREVIGKQPGDTVNVELQKDTEERTVDMPGELIDLLEKNQNLKVFFESLSYTNRKEYANWISSAKRPETKEKRLIETERRLSQGIKNPFVK